MKFFYSWVLWWIEFDIAIARSTGRNRADISRLVLERQEYELLLWKAIAHD